MDDPPAGVVRVLLLEDSDLDAELLEQELRSEGMPLCLRREQTLAGFEEGLRSFQPGLVLSDYKLAGFNGAAALEVARRVSPDVPFIVISGAVGEEVAVELIKAGATDFVLKDGLGRLGEVVRRALREVAERLALKRAQAELYTCNMELEQRVRDRTHELNQKNQLMEEDLRMAHELQLALLPRRFPTVPKGASDAESAVRVCSVYRASHVVAGDCFNVTRVSDTALSVFICDVMGHGVRAALVTAMLRVLEEQLGEKAADPAFLLGEMNRALCHIFEEAETLVFATACALTIDTQTGAVTFANAGHPSPFLLRRSAGRAEALEAPGGRGPALGLLSSGRYSNKECTVETGDVLFLFTDGLFEVENQNEESFGEGGIKQAVERHAALSSELLVRAVVGEAERFASCTSFADDVCVLGVEIAQLMAPNSKDTGKEARQPAPV